MDHIPDRPDYEIRQKVSSPRTLADEDAREARRELFAERRRQRAIARGESPPDEY